MDAATVTTERPQQTASPIARPRRPRVAERVRDIEARVQEWIRTLHRDPSAEERAMTERRARLLSELNRAVAEAPDDIPIRDVIARLNRPHWDD